MKVRKIIYKNTSDLSTKKKSMMKRVSIIGLAKNANIRFGRKGVNIRFDKGCDDINSLFILYLLANLK